MKYWEKKSLPCEGQWENAEFVWEYTPKFEGWPPTFGALKEYLDDVKEVEIAGDGGGMCFSTKEQKAYLAKPKTNKKFKFVLE